MCVQICVRAHCQFECRTLRRHVYGPPAVPQVFTPNTLTRKIGRPQSLASMSGSARGAQIPALLGAFWQTLDLSVPALSVLRAGEVQFFSQLNLDRGDSASDGDRVCILFEEDGEERSSFAVIRHIFSVVHDSQRTVQLKIACPVLPPALFALVQYFDNLADIKLKKTHRHFKALRRAQEQRLNRNDRFVTGHERLGKAYVTVQSADGLPVYEIVEAISIVRRCRMWKDTSQTGVFPCYYADV
jgi:hypothetical protein